MGLLSSSELSTGKGKVGNLIRRFSSILCLCFFLSGVAWFVGMQWPAFNGKTYFSENALLPGLVDEEFHDADAILDYAARLDRVHREHADGASEGPSVSQWILNEFHALGLEAYNQSFSIVDPLNAKKDPVRGNNVYGIVRTSRGPSLEGMALVTPLDPENSGGIALLLELANFWKDKVYWAKDIVFVFCDKDEIGARAWLSGYHETPISYLPSDPILAHSGLLQAAIVIQLPAKRYSHVNVNYNMINGQLPNLDLLNAADRLIEKEGLVSTIHLRENAEDKSFHHFTREGLEWYTRTSVKGLLAQAQPAPDGLQSSFGAYGIEAVSLEPWTGPQSDRGSGKQFGNHGNMARILEGMLRSVNNLLERFHQSFFFYILPSTKRYVSIANYMPALGLLLLGPLLKACCIWSEQQVTVVEFAKNSAASGSVANDRTPSASMLSILPAWLAAHFIGAVCLQIPNLIRIYRDQLEEMAPGFSELELLAGGYAVVAGVVLCFPRVLGLRNGEPSVPQGSLLRCIALLEMALLLGSTAVLNFSLGFLLALLYIPVLTFVRPCSSWLMWTVQSCFLLLLNPFLLTCWFAGYKVLAGDVEFWTDLMSQDSASLLHFYVPELLSRSWLQLGLELETVIGYYFHFEIWFFPLICCGVVPVWLMFWTVASSVA